MLVWSAVCAAGWFVVGAVVEDDEAARRAGEEIFCGEPGYGFLAVGVVAAAVWLLGALLIGLVRSLRRRPDG